MDLDGKLHIYGQKMWHDDVVILGDRLALETLRDAIDEALATLAGRAEDVMVNDGEGFSVIVNRIDEQSLWDTFATPYSDPDAQFAHRSGKQDATDDHDTR
jgi:hypothetical protein